MSQGGWNVSQGSGSEHTHTKFNNELEIDTQLIINSYNDNGKSWLRRDSQNTYILTDKDGDGSWDSPWPLKLDHVNNQGYVFDKEIFHQGNLPIESGTFTPKFLVTRGTEPDYQKQKGHYICTGNLVHFSARIILDYNPINIPLVAQITDFPFKFSSGFTNSSIIIGFNKNPSTRIQAMMYENTVNNIVHLYNANNGSSLTLDQLDDKFDICFGGFYAI